MTLQRSPEWLRQQVLTIGSSAAGTVVGASPYPDQTPALLYDAMVAAADGTIAEKHINDDMRRGLLTEPLHRYLLEEMLGKTIHEHAQNEFIYNYAMPWAHALPDGWMIFTKDDESDTVRIPVQLKCPRVKNWYDIKLKGVHGYWLLGSQHTLAVTGAPFEQFSVLNVESMRCLTFTVERDEKLISDLMAIEETFFKAFVARTPPLKLAQEPIELPENLGGEMITVHTEEAANAAAAWLAARAFKREAEALESDARDNIKTLMGTARAAELPGLRAYRTQQSGRLTYDHKAMSRDGIGLTKYERHGKPFDTFRAYEKIEG